MELKLRFGRIVEGKKAQHTDGRDRMGKGIDLGMIDLKLTFIECIHREFTMG